MSSFGKLQQQVYAVLRDSGKDYVLPEEVEDWINEAQLDIVSRLGINKASTASTTSATGTVVLPADFIKLENFWVATTDADVSEEPEFVDDSTFLSYKLNASTPRVTICRVFAGSIETYPAVVSRAYTLEYVKKPTVLVDPGDVPVIPEELHVKLAHYARWQSKLKEGELEEARVYEVWYNLGLPAPVTTLTRERPKSVDLLRETTYWDVQEWAN